MSVAPRESRIRALLAQRLKVLEPGLRLVEEEYRLPNAAGTGGRIDILARDQHQMWVVIELKRADKAAREAANEIAKYAELLRQHKGLPADRIRTIVVALESQWRELRAPLSNVARDWRHDLRGYSLLVEEATGMPVSARQVEWLPEPLDQRLTSIHHIYLFGQPHDRDALLNEGDVDQAITEAVVLLPSMTGGQMTSARSLAELRPLRTAAGRTSAEEFCVRFDAAVRTLAA